MIKTSEHEIIKSDLEEYKKLEEECNVVLRQIENRKKRKKIRIIDDKS